MSAQSVHFNARLPRNTVARLKDFASRHGMTASAAAAQLLDEALRMDRHPGIDFRSRSTGRTAFVTGTGLAVSEVYRIWLDHRKSEKRILRNYPHLTRARLRAAISYAEVHHREIERQLVRLDPERVGEVAPLVRTVRV